ncbi:MAG: PilZ domain-containing protein [Armatimonadetes bacterium]|nr:PilZ domain-containing protein [Armatimonadota bacterium]
MLISMLFHLFRPQASLLAVDRSRLVLRSEKPLPKGPVRVRMAVGHPDGRVRTLRKTVEVESVRKLQDGGYACVGRCRELSAADCPVDKEGIQGIRRGARYACGIRAFSPQLPGFQGIVLDFGTVGARLKTVGGLDEGTRLNLFLEPNLADLPRIEVTVRVAWCRRIDGSHQMGLEFEALPWRAREQVERFAACLAERQRFEL